MLAPIALLTLALAAPSRVAVLPVVAGEGVSDKTATALTEALAAEVRRSSGAEVITQREINAVLSLERQRAMMGCSTDACMAELGGALGVERLVNGDIARVGESLLVHVRLLEVASVRVAGQADRRFRKGTLDDLLDALPAMVAELFPGAAGADRPAARAASSAAAPPQDAAVPGPRPAPPTERPLPPPWAEEPDRLKEAQPADLAFWEDGKGHYLAMSTANLDDDVFAGSARKLHRVRVSGGSLDRGEGTGSRSFWDPRSGGRGYFDFKPDEATLVCGAQKRIPMRRVAAAEAAKLLSRAELLAPRWRRVPQLLARDDQGTYFYVDGARLANGEPADPPDYRLYVGKKGAMARVLLDDSIRDSGGLVFLTSGGRLVARQQGRKYAVEWGTATARVALTWLDPADHGPLIYRELGVYAGQELGTPCDGQYGWP